MAEPLHPELVSHHGRGAAGNPRNRFQPLTVLRDFDHPDELDPAPQTCFFKDSSRSIIAHNDSPDVGFEVSINPYRGCEHGCIYCYARPTHEYLDWSAGIDFETKILVKANAPELLRQELSSPKWQPKTLGISGVTDCYQPVERRLKLTRRCLQVLAEFRNPVGMVTKNHLITRDIDLLAELARFEAAMVHISVTTLDADLTRIMEPRTSVPKQRLAAMRELSAAGIPVGVLVAPVIPGLTDHELPAILSAAAEAGACSAGYVTLRLPFAVKDLFDNWLQRHFPDRRGKILNRIRSMRGGKLNDPNFETRMRGDGMFADYISEMFEIGCRKAGIKGRGGGLSTAAFRRPAPAQVSLFE